MWNWVAPSSSTVSCWLATWQENLNQQIAVMYRSSSDADGVRRMGRVLALIGNHAEVWLVMKKFMQVPDGVGEDLLQTAEVPLAEIDRHWRDT